MFCGLGILAYDYVSICLDAMMIVFIVPAHYETISYVGMVREKFRFDKGEDRRGAEGEDEQGAAVEVV